MRYQSRSSSDIRSGSSVDTVSSGGLVIVSDYTSRSAILWCLSSRNHGSDFLCQRTSLTDAIILRHTCFRYRRLCLLCLNRCVVPLSAMCLLFSLCTHASPPLIPYPITLDAGTPFEQA